MRTTHEERVEMGLAKRRKPSSKTSSDEELKRLRELRDIAYVAAEAFAVYLHSTSQMEGLRALVRYENALEAIRDTFATYPVLEPDATSIKRLEALYDGTDCE